MGFAEYSPNVPHVIIILLDAKSLHETAAMDVYIAKLRKYLKKDDSISIITMHGEGFKLIDIK